MAPVCPSPRFLERVFTLALPKLKIPTIPLYGCSNRSTQVRKSQAPVDPLQPPASALPLSSPSLSTLNCRLSTFPQKGKPRISWGEEIRGWGLTAEGGRRKLVLFARYTEAVPQCTWCVEIKQICRSSS